MRIKMLTPDLEAPPTGPLLSPVAIPWLFDFQAAIEQLQMMHPQKIEDSLVAAIHPKRRRGRGSEKAYPAPGDRQAIMFPALNLSAIDDWFIKELEKLLSSVGCRAVNKVISATFEAAVGHSYDLSRIATRRKRLKDRANAKTLLWNWQNDQRANNQSSARKQ
jgi:hypothetical protein